MSVRVKVCGLTRVQDAAAALEAGADALGVVFAQSQRRVTATQAKAIAREAGPWVPVVGVFVNESTETMLRLIESCRLSAVQLHGDEARADKRLFEACRVIKAFRVASKADLESVQGFKADAYLFDTKAEGFYGGSGRSFDWRLLKGKDWGVPNIISGGLTPSSVAQAVRMLAPYGVDVSSGIEKKPGIKDARLIKEFIRRAKD
jgi:phosphoribosylanthranilate isomerase